MLAGTPTSTGAVVSTRVMVWLQSAMLPQASVAFQVRVAAKVPPQSGLVTVLAMEIRTFVPSHASVAVGGSNCHVVPHWMVRSLRQVMTGAVVSMMVTDWLLVALLPQAS